jgi:maltose phosphorylase
VEMIIHKYGIVLSSENHPKEKMTGICRTKLEEVVTKGFDSLLADHVAIWKHKWESCDITIPKPIPEKING